MEELTEYELSIIRRLIHKELCLLHAGHFFGIHEVEKELLIIPEKVGKL